MSRVFRNATSDDLDSIYQIIKDAKVQLKAAGSSQWQSLEPSYETLKRDVESNTCYVIDEQGIIATLNLSFDGDIAYRSVFGGAWSVDAPYATLHRVAIAQNYQCSGIMHFMLDEVVRHSILEEVYQIRIDTYYKNERMINSILRYGFKRIGIIHVEDPLDPKREAFEYIFEPS